MTVAQKILAAHLVEGDPATDAELGIRIDQTLTQDATGTMAYLQFESMGVKHVKNDLAVSYVDHNTVQIGFENADDHDFLASIAKKYGIVYSKAGAPAERVDVTGSFKFDVAKRCLEKGKELAEWIGEGDVSRGGAKQGRMNMSMNRLTLRKLLSLVAVLSVWSFASPLAAYEVFVDAAAAPGGDGSSAKPFATADAARDVVRAARKAGRIAPTESAVVTFAPGDYPQLTAFKLAAEDSGTSVYAPVVYRAAKPRTVRFTGGAVLKAKDFSPVTDEAVLARLPEEARAKARVADVSKVITKDIPPQPPEFTGAPPPLVFMKGRIVESARWPNAGEYAQFFRTNKVDDLAFAFDNPRAKRWDVSKGLWLCGYWTHDWYQNVVKVGRIGPEEVTGPDGKKEVRENVIRFATKFSYGVMAGTYGGHQGRRFYAFNLLDELDAPGEWYYDRAAKRLYVIPLDGNEVRDEDDVILTVNDTTVVSAAQGVRFVRFEGLDFAGTGRQLVDFTVADGAVENCRFSCCGTTGLAIGGAARRVRVANCEVERIGGKGISVSAGNAKTLERGEVTVENCRIHAFGQISRTYNGAIHSHGVGNTFRKCEIWDAPHLAIGAGGQYNVYEFNNIHHVMLDTADAGAYYSGRQLVFQGNILRYNFFHDMGCATGGGSCVAIYYDDCGSGEQAYGNIIHNAGLAFLVGGGRDHPIRNNIISHCIDGISLNSRGMEWPCFNDPACAKDKGSDTSQLLTRNARRAVDFETGVWLDRFPRLADVANDDWAMPYFNPVENNIFLDMKRSIIHVSRGDHFKADRMAPIAGNLVISTTGAKNVATNVPAHVAKGFKVLAGTPEKPFDLGIDSLAAGDFRFLPESLALKACPGYDVIPFDEIPNTSVERPLTDYAGLAKDVNGRRIWTAALQKALDENERVRIPASSETYWIDAPVVIPAHRRINAHGATVSLAPGCNTLMLRNAAARDGQVSPVPADAPRDADIAITGGTWCDWRDKRAGYGTSGMFNLDKREVGNFFGVSTLFYFGCVDGLSLTSVKFRHCAAFAVQCGDATDLAFRHIRFDRCFADGLHLNGNIARVRGFDIKGAVGDDLVALNAYDWKNSSVNFGPQTDIAFEDLELIPPPKGWSYPAIRIQPAVYRYADGREVDCAISNVVFRKVRGIRTFKMYAQTPRRPVGTSGEWYRVGSGGNILFEDVDIDLTAPIDCMGGYKESDPVRGHFAPFEFGANLSKVTFRDVTVNFHCDRWPHCHLATVGPKSCLFKPKKPDEKAIEVFNPDLSCEVGEVVLDNVKIRGNAPAELVYAVAFDNVNGDGCSTGRGVIRKLNVVPTPPPREGVCPRHVLNHRHRTASAAEANIAKAWQKNGRQKTLDWFRTNAFADAPSATDVTFDIVLPKGADAAHPVPVIVVGQGASENAARVTIPTNTITGRGYALVTWKTAGAISADGFSKAADWIAQRPELDAKRIIVFGYGTDGRAALWAGAQDKRIVLAIADASGLGRADFKRGSDLIRLMAPRFAYVSSAYGDTWDESESEYAAVVQASALWRGLGKRTLALTCRWKDVYPNMTDHSGRVGYHLRPDKGATSPYDWDRYLDYADVRLKAR